ncbi:MAG: hypothetical protein IIX86_09930 [Clostridia bacterium]|nr:hypothetical protein [Clostridia bacterium]
MAVRKKNNGALAGHKFSAKKQKRATARLPVTNFLQKSKKEQQCARGSRLGGGGALLRRGMPERNKKPIMRCNKGLSPVTRNT